MDSDSRKLMSKRAPDTATCKWCGHQFAASVMPLHARRCNPLRLQQRHEWDVWIGQDNETMSRILLAMKGQ